MLRVRREYKSWVAKESLADYALRYAASSYRRWSPRVAARNRSTANIRRAAIAAAAAVRTTSVAPSRFIDRTRGTR